MEVTLEIDGEKYRVKEVADVKGSQVAAICPLSDCLFLDWHVTHGGSTTWYVMASFSCEWKMPLYSVSDFFRCPAARCLLRWKTKGKSIGST